MTLRAGKGSYMPLGMDGGQRKIGKVHTFKHVGSWEGIQIYWSAFSIYTNIHIHTIHYPFIYTYISYIIYTCVDTYVCIYTYRFYTQGQQGVSACSYAWYKV